jgi:hypothetical protein
MVGVEFRGWSRCHERRHHRARGRYL